MYYLAKIIQALGLGLIGFGFIRKFPELMNPRIFLAGIVIFIIGWLIEQYLLR